MMYTSLGMAVESSDGYASSINGAAETPSRTCKRTIRAQLIRSSMSNIFHCFAGAYSPWIYNNVIHRITGEIPSLKLWGKFVSVKYLRPLGARVKVLTNLPSKRALTARTSGDTREEEYNDDANAITIIDASQKSSFTGRFLGYSQHPNVMLILKEGNDTEPSRIIHAHHAYVDPFGFSSSTSPNDMPLHRMNDCFLLLTTNSLTRQLQQLGKPKCKIVI